MLSHAQQVILKVVGKKWKSSNKHPFVGWNDSHSNMNEMKDFWQWRRRKSEEATVCDYLYNLQPRAVDQEVGSLCFLFHYKQSFRYRGEGEVESVTLRNITVYRRMFFLHVKSQTLQKGTHRRSEETRRGSHDCVSKVKLSPSRASHCCQSVNNRSILEERKVIDWVWWSEHSVSLGCTVHTVRATHDLHSTSHRYRSDGSQVSWTKSRTSLIRIGSAVFRATSHQGKPIIRFPLRAARLRIELSAFSASLTFQKLSRPTTFSFPWRQSVRSYHTLMHSKVSLVLSLRFSSTRVTVELDQSYNACSICTTCIIWEKTTNHMFHHEQLCGS